MKIKVGFGFDVHQLSEGRECWIGGIKLEHDKGPLGHSDADVLLHAICDAILGAANLKDIGFHFKNTDPQWAGVDSKILLKECCRMVREKGYEISNIDSSLTLEAPKINPHIDKMQEVIAEVMEINIDDVSIKATTNEKLGYVGREEGINAYAVALLIKE